ncbi:hypothetical protein, partial [Paenarthrobacter sp. NPDC090522]|uniref:hypothetical protein n=1 Tax=Paenarthrobacter sp. NPDC090522 TaxID=3364383 RepID=UPI00381ADF03
NKGPHTQWENGRRKTKKHQNHVPSKAAEGPVASGPNSAPNTTPTTNTPDAFPTTTTVAVLTPGHQPKNHAKKTFDLLIFHP